MNLMTMFDSLFDKLENQANKIFDAKFDEFWFTWLSWILVSGAIFGIASRDNSFTLYIVSGFSAYLLFFKAVHYTEKTVLSLRPEIKRRSVAFYAVVVFAGCIPFVLMFIIGGIFSGLLQS